MLCRAFFLVFFCVGVFCASAFAQKPELVVQTGHNPADDFIFSFSPNGKYLATAGKYWNAEVKIWHVETGKEIASLQPVPRGYSALYWNPISNNLHILSGFGSKSYVYDGTTFQLKSTSSKLFRKPTGAMAMASYNQDGSLYVVNGFDSPLSGKDSITVLESTSNTVRAILPTHHETAFFSPNGKLLLTFGENELKVWSADTFQEIWKYRTDSTTDINSWTFSSDSRLLCCGLGDSTIQCFEGSTGKLMFTPIQTLLHTAKDVVFMPNSRHLLSLGSDSTIKMWDVEQGKLLKTVCKYGATAGTLCVSHSGKTAALAWAFEDVSNFSKVTQVRLFVVDIGSGKILHELSGNVNPIESFVVKPDGSSLWAVSQGSSTFVNKWDITSLSKSQKRLVRKLPSRVNTNCIVSEQGNMIVCEYMRKKAIVWNTATDSVLLEINAVKGESISFAAVSSDLSYFVLLCARNNDQILDIDGFKRSFHTLRVYALNTSKELWSDSTFGLNAGATSLVASKDHSMFFLPRLTLRKNTKGSGFGFREHTTIYDSKTGKKLLQNNDTTNLLNKSTGFPQFTVENTLSFKKRKDTTINPRTSAIELLKPSFTSGLTIEKIDGDILIAKNSKGDTITFHIPTQRQIPSRFATGNHTFTKDAKFAFKADNSSILVIDATTGKDLANLYTLDSTNWAVTTPDGRFDGSEGGLRYLHFVVGNEPIELEQLKERYYEPGLLSKLMGYNKEPLREIERFESVKLYPRIEVQQGDNSAKASTKSEAKSDAKPRSKTNAKSTARSITPNTPNASSNLTFTVKLTNQGGGFGRVPVWLNGKELTDDARPQNARTDAADMTITLNLEGNRLLLPGTTNTLEVRAFNAENAVLSRSAKHDFQAPGERLQSAPHLYAIVGGTSDYQGEELDLPFAAADAEQIAKAVRIAGERLLGADRVHIALLTSKRDSAQSKTRTTKANIVAALKEVQTKATANDILFVYLTGHGINWGGQDGDWYYLTTDARLGDDEKFTDAALRTSVALSSRELTDLMKAIPARKQTLALDACASGKAVENLLASRDVPSSQLRAMMRMKDRAGLHVISGCASNAVSYEASRYGQGLLTYSLLMGMKGGALRDNQFVDVKQLFEFAADRVPELARDIGRVQKPQVCSPFGGGSFDIGLVTEAEAKSIPLADAKPLFVRANFQDEKKMYDQLNLGKIVNESLRGVTYRAATNPFEAWLVYLDVPEFPNSYALNGRYTIKGDEITVSAVLRRGEEEGTVFTVKGAAANVKELAQTLVTETQKRMK